MSNIVIHIPYSSLDGPNFYKKRLMIPEEKFNSEKIFISDYLIDYFAPEQFSNIIKFKFSRLFCDVERFKDNNLESMSKKEWE